jgi:hypothetical protein
MYNDRPNGGKSKANLKEQRNETTSTHLDFCCSGSPGLWSDLTLALKRLWPNPEAQFDYRQERAKIVDFALENKGVKRGILAS